MDKFTTTYATVQHRTITYYYDATFSDGKYWKACCDYSGYCARATTEQEAIQKVIDMATKIVKKEIPRKDLNTLSDGNHTFHELYRHRVSLYLLLMSQNIEISWISRKHHDGVVPPDGVFIAGIDFPSNNVTYHVPVNRWDVLVQVGVPVLDVGKSFDGHSSDDVLDRLLNVLMQKSV